MRSIRRCLSIVEGHRIDIKRGTMLLRPVPFLLLKTWRKVLIIALQNDSRSLTNKVRFNLNINTASELVC
jgi:hypothetical protein